MTIVGEFGPGDRVCIPTGRCGTVEHTKSDGYGNKYSAVLFDRPSSEKIPSRMLSPEPTMFWRETHPTKCRNCGFTNLMKRIDVNHDEWLATVYLCLVCGYTEAVRE